MVTTAAAAQLGLGSILLHGMTTLAFVLHIGGGSIGLVSGSVAAFARKGGRLHRAAGNVFFVSMLVMAAFAAWLAVAMPGQIVNLFIAIFAFYLVATAWLTVRRHEGAIGLSEKIALFVALVLCGCAGHLPPEGSLGRPPCR